MCGIVGYTGPREAGPILIEGLKRQRSGNRFTHFRAQGRCRVMIEISALVHALPKLAAIRRRLTLARAPVAHAMKRGLQSDRSKRPADLERPCLEQF